MFIMCDSTKLRNIYKLILNSKRCEECIGFTLLCGDKNKLAPIFNLK